MRPTKKSILFYFILSVFVGVGVLAIMGKFVKNFNLGLFASFHFSYYLVPVVLFFFVYIIDALRLMIVTHQLGFKVGFFDAVVNNMVGFFFTSMTPLAMGGQPFQIHHLTRIGIPSEDATNIVVSRFLEFMVTVLSFSLFAFKSVVSSLQDSAAISARLLAAGFGVSVVGFILILFLFLKPQILVMLLRWASRLPGFSVLKKKDVIEGLDRWIRRMKQSAKFLWQNRLPFMLLDTGLGVLSLCFMFSPLYYSLNIFTGVEGVSSFLRILATALLLNLVVFYLPTPGASGGTEAVYQLVFADMTGNASGTLAAIVLWRFSTFYLQLGVTGLVIFTVGNVFGPATVRRRAK
ncbi:MAG: glycosyltransferase 2 family protein [Thermotogota bacterium]|nr:glycosyltransferase 2 family protein [Thermotogota bacterium]MDK2863893.1 glycosyltransferase 2 family protein [Thermotogota bacterium]HCZ07115.1 hypothetical protein [Thermotogota bacterium]